MKSKKALTWRKIIINALREWKRTKKNEDAKSVVMWAAIAAKAAPEIFNETR